MNMKLTLATYLLLLLCITVNAQTAEAYFQSAVKHAEKGNLKNALVNIEKAVELDSTNMEYYQLWAEALYFSGDIEGGEAMCEYALLIDSSYYSLYLLLSTIREFKEDDHGSIRALDEGMQYAPDDSILCRFISNKGWAQFHIQDYEGSYHTLMKGYEIDTTNEHILSTLGVTCGRLGKKEEALFYIRRSAEYSDKDNPTAHMNTGFILQRMGYYMESLEYFDLAIEIDPEMAFAYSNRSYSKLMVGDTKGAMKDIQKSIKLDPSNSYAYRNKGLIHLRKNEWEDACTNFYYATQLGFKKNYGDEVEDLMKEFCGR